jgi:hypothetical protein
MHNSETKITSGSNEINSEFSKGGGLIIKDWKS